MSQNPSRNTVSSLFNHLTPLKKKYMRINRFIKKLTDKEIIILAKKAVKIMKIDMKLDILNEESDYIDQLANLFFQSNPNPTYITLNAGEVESKKQNSTGLSIKGQKLTPTKEYLSTFNIELLHKKDLIRGKINRNDDGKIIDSSLAKEDILFWSGFLPIFESLIEEKIIKKLPKNRKHVFSTFNVKQGKSVLENKADSIMKINRYIVSQLSPENQQKFINEILLDNIDKRK